MNEPTDASAANTPLAPPHAELVEQFMGLMRKFVEARASHKPHLHVWSSTDELLLNMVKEPVVVEDLALPDGVEAGPLKECFTNAYRLSVANPRYQYAEGYAFALVPAQHAWCVDTETGQIVDPTWASIRPERQRPVAYLGLRFSHEFQRRIVAEEKQPSIFEADWRREGRTARCGLILGPDGAVVDWGDPPPF